MSTQFQRMVFSHTEKEMHANFAIGRIILSLGRGCPAAKRAGQVRLLNPRRGVRGIDLK